MKIFWPYQLFVLFLSFEFIFSFEYLKKYGSKEIHCDNNNIIIFDSSSFPIPSTIYFKFSIDSISNSSFDKVKSYEYDFLEISNEPNEINNNEIIFTTNENYDENNTVINTENTIKSRKTNIDEKKNVENSNRNYINENHKFRYVIYPSGESFENSNNINYNLTYFNIDKNKDRVGDKFGNNLLIDFNCKGILKIENTEKDFSSELSNFAIIGIVAGGVLFIIIIVVILVCYFKKNMEKKDDKKLNKNKKNKTTAQGRNDKNINRRNRKNHNRLLSNQRFTRLSVHNSTKSSFNKIKKRKKSS